MGLVYKNFQVFLDARRRGASFARTLAVGRQQMTFSAGEVRRTLPTRILWQFQGSQQLRDYALSNLKVYEPWTSLPRTENAIEHNA